MLLPKSRGLGVTLHSAENWDNLAMGNRWATKMLCPPFVESTVGSDEETLFWRWCFAKSIAYICAVDNDIFDGGDSIK